MVMVMEVMMIDKEERGGCCCAILSVGGGVVVSLLYMHDCDGDDSVAQLLKIRRIRASDSGKVLMKLVANPVTQYFPQGAASKVYGMSYSAEEVVDMPTFLKSSLFEDGPCVVVVGAVAHGSIEERADYCTKFLRISDCPLSAAVRCVLGWVVYGRVTWWGREEGRGKTGGRWCQSLGLFSVVLRVVLLRASAALVREFLGSVLAMRAWRRITPPSPPLPNLV